MKDLKGFTSGKGRIGTVRFYSLSGLPGTFASTIGGATREQINTLPSMEQVRLLNTEWKAVTAMCKRTLQGLALISTELPTSYMPGRLNHVFKDMQIADTSNSKGSRAIFPVAQKLMLQGFELNPNTSFSSAFKKPVTPVWTNRKAVNWDAGVVNPNQLNPPVGATHYKLAGLLFSLPPATRSMTNEHYELIDVVDEIVYTESAYVLVSQAQTPGALVLSFAYSGTMTADTAAVLCVECQFFQQIGIIYEPLRTGSAASILSIV